MLSPDIFKLDRVTKLLNFLVEKFVEFDLECVNYTQAGFLFDNTAIFILLKSGIEIIVNFNSQKISGIEIPKDIRIMIEDLKILKEQNDKKIDGYESSDNATVIDEYYEQILELERSIPINPDIGVKIDIDGKRVNSSLLHSRLEEIFKSTKLLPQNVFAVSNKVRFGLVRFGIISLNNNTHNILLKWVLKRITRKMLKKMLKKFQRKLK